MHTTKVSEALESEESVMSPDLYRERLVPGVWWWLIVMALIGMIAIAYGAALGASIGLVVAAGLGVISVVAILRSSPLLEVSDAGIRCGRATLPQGSWLPPRLVDTQAMSAVRRGLDPEVGDRLFHVLPPWLGRQGVLVPISDLADPHTAWLVGTRHPRQLIDALCTRVAE